MNRIFVGYDHRQPVAFHVCVQSIMDKCSAPVSITPLVYETLPIRHKGLTPFTYSRFLVPWLCGFQGRAIFMDSDFFVRDDIKELLEENTGNAVDIVPHERKFERPSLMRFDCQKCSILTPEFVNDHYKDLFSLTWAESIGTLDQKWNYLVGYDAPAPDTAIAHFTQGLPCFPMTKNAIYGDEWRKTAQRCVTTASWEELMGNSVHAQYVRQT